MPRATSSFLPSELGTKITRRQSGIPPNWTGGGESLRTAKCPPFPGTDIQKQGRGWHGHFLGYQRSMSDIHSTHPETRCLPANNWPLPSLPCAFSLSSRNGWPGKPRFDSAVASFGYYRQRATGHHRPAAREQSHLLRLRQRALHLLSACISGSQALMKGGRNDHI